MGLIQIDSVNVLVRSQELALFARLGPHPRTLIADASRDGELFEYWVHEACHVPVSLHPYLRWQMNSEHRWKAVAALRHRRPEFIDEVRIRIDDEGPLVAGDLKQRVGPKGTWWDWDDGKIALEYLFWAGEVAADPSPERLRPHLRPHSSGDSGRHPRVADTIRDRGPQGTARAGGAAPRRRQRSRTSPTTTASATRRARALIGELVEEGRLIETSVEGWSKPAYLHPDAVMPRRVSARALLSPFDPLVWNRDRTERLFGFRYRIEIYVPAPKRQYGYYVLPFLLGDELVAPRRPEGRSGDGPSPGAERIR